MRTDQTIQHQQFLLQQAAQNLTQQQNLQFHPSQIFNNGSSKKKKTSNSSKSLAHNQKNFIKSRTNLNNNSENFANGALSNSINNMNVFPTTTTATGNLYGYIQQVSGKNSSLSPAKNSSKSNL